MSQSADQSTIISRLAPVYQPSPLMSRRNMDSRTRATSPRGGGFSNLRKFNSAAKLNEENVTPPGSPPSFRFVYIPTYGPDRLCLFINIID